MASYDKAYDRRDRQAAEWILKSPDLYANHTDQHLRNALKYAQGCSGSEAVARIKLIRKEMRKRRIS